MATIQARTTKGGKTSYRVQIRLKGHPAQRATFERKTDAKRWAAQTESAIREGRHFKGTEAKRRTLAELIDRYTRDVLPTKKAKTQDPRPAGRTTGMVAGSVGPPRPCRCFSRPAGRVSGHPEQGADTEFRQNP